MSTNFAANVDKNIVKENYNSYLETRITKVSKTAGNAIESFATLIEQINKLQNESKGNKDVEVIANDMNNSMVMVTRLLAAQFEALNKVVTPETIEG